MHIPALTDPVHSVPDPVQIHGPPDLPESIPVHGLHADLQLDQPRAHAPDQPDLFLVQQVRSHLEMEVRDPSVMRFNISPHFHGMVMAAVKCPVHKFHLRDFMVDKKLQFFFHHADVPEPQAFIYGRQAVTARERAAPARLIVNDAVFKIPDMAIGERHAAQVQDRAQRVLPDLPAFVPVNDAFYF